MIRTWQSVWYAWRNYIIIISEWFMRAGSTGWWWIRNGKIDDGYTLGAYLLGHIEIKRWMIKLSHLSRRRKRQIICGSLKSTPQRFLMIATFLVFICHDWTPGIKLSGTVHPHITLAVRVVAVCYHLRWCFIRLRDM